jgi:pseudouridine kinase
MNSNGLAAPWPPTVVVVGGANLDIVAHTDCPLVAADSNPGHVHCVPGGVGRNVAHNLALLGQPTALVSVMGDDAFGQVVLDATAAAGVDTRHCVQVPGARTATYLSLHGVDGDMAVAINDMAILERLDASVLAPLWPTLQAARCLVLDCNLHDDALAFLLDGRLQAPVLVDAVSAAKCPRLTPWLARIHTLKVNRLEAAALTGLCVQTTADAWAAVRALHQCGVAQVILSQGRDGVVWSTQRGDRGHCPARAVPVVNTSGAGDALLAGLVQGQLQAWPLAQAVPWAMACAEITLQSLQANAPELSLAAVERQCAMAHSPIP